MRVAACCVVVLLAGTLCRAQAQYPRPRRPERFESGGEGGGVNTYLKELQDYYSVHGRGRFGKRQLHIADASIIFNESPVFDHNLKDDPLWKNLGFK